MGMDVYGENPKIHTPQPQRPETEDYDSDELQQQYKEARDRHLEGLADEDCNLCDSTGIRNDEYVQGECNGCHGTGKKPHWDTHYPFDEENVKEFKNFVKESGGFRIN